MFDYYYEHNQQLKSQKIICPNVVFFRIYYTFTKPSLMSPVLMCCFCYTDGESYA